MYKAPGTAKALNTPSTGSYLRNRDGYTSSGRRGRLQAPSYVHSAFMAHNRGVRTKLTGITAFQSDSSLVQERTSWFFNGLKLRMSSVRVRYSWHDDHLQHFLSPSKVEYPSAIRTNWAPWAPIHPVASQVLLPYTWHRHLEHQAFLRRNKGIAMPAMPRRQVPGLQLRTDW